MLVATAALLVTLVSEHNFQYHIPVTASGQMPGQPLLTDTIRRHEVDLVLSNQNALLNTARDIK
jgi:hypothetical protein